MDESSREVPNLRNLRLPMRLKVGDYVKLHNGYQSIWVKIISPRLWHLKGEIIREVRESDDGNQKGDIIKFQPCNILDIKMDVDEFDD